MVQGPLLLVILIAAIAFIIVMTARVHLNAFLVLLFAAFGTGLASGMEPLSVVSTITGGFGNILSYIGIVIIAGTIIGTILEKSGATITLAETVLKLVGSSRASLAMSATGAVVSISVFCDSGFVILASLNRSLARKSGIPMGVMAVALSTGLYATHTLVPPTPGPLAAAGNLGADIGMVIMLGLIVSVPAVLAGYCWASFAGKRYDGDLLELSSETAGPVTGNLPGTIISFAPILAPILLITLKSIAAFPGHPFGERTAKHLLDFIGDPTVALLLGVLIAFSLLPRWDSEHLNGWVGHGLTGAGAIIMITGAGGAFGAVLKATPIGDYLSGVLAQYNMGIFLPFIIAAALKTAQGSTTVALITTSALIAPLLPDLGLDSGAGRALSVMSVGAGSMIVSHANDSYFWVVSQFSGLSPSAAYRTHTIATLMQGLTAMAAVFMLTLIMI